MALEYYKNWNKAYKDRTNLASVIKKPTVTAISDVSRGAKKRIRSLVDKQTAADITFENEISVGQQYYNAFGNANDEYIVANAGRVVTRDPDAKVFSSAFSDKTLQKEMLTILSSGDTKRNDKGLDVRATKTEPLKEFIFNFIVDREGFVSIPHDDSKKGSKKPVWRAGFGSDTYTKEDGTVVTVKQDSFVSKEDAIRDLNRRIKTEFMPRAKRSVGSNTWNTLGESTQTALTSYVYNYGNIGESIIKAANSGSTRKLADAVRARAVDNNNINSGRRNEEADLIESDMSGQEILASTRKRNK